MRYYVTVFVVQYCILGQSCLRSSLGRIGFQEMFEGHLLVHCSFESSDMIGQ